MRIDRQEIREDTGDIVRAAKDTVRRVETAIEIDKENPEDRVKEPIDDEDTAVQATL